MYEEAVKDEEKVSKLLRTTTGLSVRVGMVVPTTDLSLDKIILFIDDEDSRQRRKYYFKNYLD